MPFMCACPKSNHGKKMVAAVVVAMCIFLCGMVLMAALAGPVGAVPRLLKAQDATSGQATQRAKMAISTAKRGDHQNKVIDNIVDQGRSYRKICNATVHTANPDTLSQLADLSYLPPYYLIGTSSVTRPIVNALIFGPPRLKPLDESYFGMAKRVGKQIIQAGFLGLAVLQAIDDGRDIGSLWWAEMSTWEKVLASLVVLCTSGNMQNSFNVYGIFTAYFETEKWSTAHGVPLHMWDALGIIGSIYVIGLIFCYSVPSFIFLLFCLPSIIAYLYVSIALYLVVALISYTCAFCMSKFYGLYGNTESSQIVLKELDFAQKDAVMKSISAGFPYEEEMDSYMKAGLPRTTWTKYMMMSTFGIIPQFVMPMTARLYSAQGYWTSLTRTVGERHIATYACYTFLSATSLLKAVALFI